MPTAHPRDRTSNLWIQTGAALAVHLVSALLLVVALAILVPSSAAVYGDFRSSLPVPTSLALGASELLVRWWFLAAPLGLLAQAGDAGVLVFLGQRARAGWVWLWAVGVAAAVGGLAVLVLGALLLPTLPCC